MPLRLSLNRRWFRRGVFAVSICVALLAGVLAAYSYALHRSAMRVLASAGRIASMADAERELEGLRGTFATWQSERVASSNEARIRQIQIENRLLTSLHLVPHTVLSLAINSRGEDLKQVVVVMYSGDGNSLSGAWVQEDFAAPPRAMYVSARRDGTGRPFKVVVEFSNRASSGEKEKALAVNVGCLTRLLGCRSAADILPTVWSPNPPTDVSTTIPNTSMVRRD